ncbi:MAG TPA: DinB family protein [Flavisolibacter sp.]|nr:DinB family protein [Flavisolibacter sp.]
MTKQTPWVERSFSFNFPTGIFPVIFSRLEGTIFRLYSLLSNADEDVCSVSSQGWSVKEHLGHMFELEALWWQRLSDFAQNKAVLSPADTNNPQTAMAGHNEKSLEQLLEAFTLERQRMLEGIYFFKEDMLTKTSLHPRLNQSMRVIDALYFVAEHDDHHISAISNLLRRPEEEAVNS